MGAAVQTTNTVTGRSNRIALLAGALALALVSTAFLAVRVAASRDGAPAWLFWPFLVVEAYALLRVVLLGLRAVTPAADPLDLRSPVPGAAERGSAEPVFVEPEAVETVILVTGEPGERIDLAAVAASRTRCGAVALVGPDDEELDGLARRFALRRVVARGSDLDLLFAAARTTEADVLVVAAGDCVVHHDAAQMVRDLLADPRTGWAQSDTRPAPQRDVLDDVDTGLMRRADGANGVAELTGNGSAVRVAVLLDAMEATVGEDEVDFATLNVVAQQLGWRGTWSDISLAVRNAAELDVRSDDVAEAAGRLRLGFTRRSPVWAGSLRWRSRLAYVSSVAEDKRGLVAAALLVIAAAALVSGRLPFSLDAPLLLVGAAAVHGCSALLRRSVTLGLLGPEATARTSISGIDISLASVATALRPGSSWARRLSQQRVRAAFVLAVVVQAALALRAITALTSFPLPDTTRATEMVLFGGTVILSVPLLRAAEVIIPVRFRREGGRHEGHVSAWIGDDEVHVLDLSPWGLGAVGNASPEVGESVTIEVLLPGEQNPKSVSARVRSSEEMSDGWFRVGIEFGEMSRATAESIMSYWVSGWIPEVATPAIPEHNLRDGMRVRVNRGSNPGVRMLTAVALIATGAATLPPYGIAGAEVAPLPPDTLALRKSVPATTLYGTPSAVELTAFNTWAPGDGGSERYYNASFRDVLPDGAQYVEGSGSPAPTTVLVDRPTDGETTLIWENVGDAQPGSSVGVAYSFQHNRTGADDDTLMVGDTVGGEAGVFANTDPRSVPDFDDEGAATTGDSSHTHTATAAGSTTIVPLTIDKREPSGESELMRGVHDQDTTYSLVVTNNPLVGDREAVVEDWLPAELEFLGCGTTDHTPDLAVEYPGAPRLDTSTTDLDGAGGCLPPVTVETVETDPDAAGPLPAGVYTHVVWNVGDLGPAESRTISYRAGISEFANAPWAEGTAPSPACGAAADSCGQVANLGNNTGPRTTETSSEQSLSNLATVTATYAGRVAGGAAPRQVWDRSVRTVTAEDLAVTKSGCNTTDRDASSDATGTSGSGCLDGVTYGGLTTWVLSIRTGEYRDASALVATDTLPDGLSYSTGSATVSVDGGEARSSEPIMGSGSGGTQVLTWDLGRMAPNSLVELTFSSVTDTTYRATGAPVLAFDILRNRAAVDATTAVVNGTDASGPQDVGDESADSLRSEWSQIDKTVLRGAEAAATRVGDVTCSPGLTGTGVPENPDVEPRFVAGDVVCFELQVAFPSGLRVADAIVHDFLAPNTEFVGAVARGDQTDDVSPEPLTVEGFGDALVWNVGTPVDGEPRYTDADGSVFHLVVAARVLGDPRLNNDADLYQNLLKVTGRDSRGVTVSLRDMAGYRVAEPVLDLTKGAVDLLRDGVSVDGYPMVAPEDGNDSHVVQGSDTVGFRLDIANTAPQLALSGEPGSTPTPDPATDAVDVEVWDRLPAGLSCAQLAGGVGGLSATLGATDGVIQLDPPPTADIGEVDCSRNRLSFTAGLIPAGHVLRVDYAMEVPSSVGAGARFRNTAGVRTYADGRDGISYYPESNIDPTVEPNAPVASDDSTVAAPAATVAKNRTTSVQEAGNAASNRATIGELITYTIAAVVPAGTTVLDARVNDELPDGLEHVVGSVAVTTSDPPGLAGFGPEDEPSGFGLTDDEDGWVLSFPAAYSNAGDTDHVFTVTAEALVVDTDANVHGRRARNTARLQWRPDPASTRVIKRSSSRNTNIVEPQPTLTKTHEPAGPFTGDDVVAFTLGVGNATGRSPLHDPMVVDCSPPGLGSITPTGAFADRATVDTGDPCGGDSTRITWDLSALRESGGRPDGVQPGETLALTYTAVVERPAAAGSSLRNTAKVTGASLPALKVPPPQCAALDLLNGGFEDYDVPGSTWAGVPSSRPGVAWRNTAEGTVEIWNSRFLGVTSAEGTQHAELNHNRAGTLYQDLATDPGTTMRWSLQHRGRARTESMRVLIGPPGGPLVQSGPDIVTPRSRWQEYSGSYRIPEGQTTTRFAFQSNVPGSVGNFLDDVVFTPEECHPDVVEDRARTTYSADAQDTLEVTQATVAKSVTPETGVPGGEVAYTLAATVPAGTVAHDVTLVDTLPANLVHLSHDLPDDAVGPGCTIDGEPHTIAADGQRFGWFLGDITAGDADCVITLVASARIRGAASNGDTLANAAAFGWNTESRVDDIDDLDPDHDLIAKGTAEVAVLEPELTVEKTVDDPDAVVEAGQPVTYSVSISNTGTEAAWDIAVTDTLPDGLGAPTSIGGTCEGAELGTHDADDSTITWDPLFSGAVGLASGASCTLGYTQVVDSATSGALEDGGVLRDTVSVTEFWADPDHEDDEYTSYEGPSATADVTTYLPALSLDKLTGAGTEVGAADVGAPFTWSLNVSNTGRGTAYGVDVSDTLPPNWQVDPASVVLAPATCGAELAVTGDVATGQTLTWTDVCDLAGRTGVVITFDATPLPAAAADPGLLDGKLDKVRHPNTATAGASDLGGDPLDPVEDDAAAELRSVDLRLRKTDSSPDGEGGPDSAGFTVGSPGAYFVDVSNGGPDAEPGPITVSDTIPAGLSATAASGDGWNCDVTGGGTGVNCVHPGPLAVDSNLPRITVTVDVGLEALNVDANHGLVLNTASVSGTSPDNDPSNNADDEPTPVNRVADVAIAKSLDAATPFVPGTDVNYLVTVTNEGPSPARGDVVVTDPLPDRLHLVSAGGDGWDCAASDIPVAGPTPGSASEPGVGFSGEDADDNGAVSCTRVAADLPRGAVLPPITVVATVDPSTPTGAEVRNVATVAHEGDPNAANDTSDESGDPDPNSKLAINKDDGGATFVAGQSDARQYVTVSNLGPSTDAGPVTVTDDIESGLRLVDVAAGGWDCDVETGASFADGERGSLACTWTGGSAGPAPVGVGQSLTPIELVLEVSPAAITDPRPDGSNTVSNTASVSGANEEPVEAEVATPVVPKAGLTVDKSHDEDSAPWRVGGTGAFELVVGNDGPSGEYGRVLLTDELPDGLTFRSAEGDGWDCEFRDEAGDGPNGSVRCRHDRSGVGDDDVLLAVGDTLAPVTVTVEVGPEAAPVPYPGENSVVNSAAATGVTDPEGGKAVDEVPTLAVADLAIEKTTELEELQVGESATYSVEVTNLGPSVSSAPIAVTDPLPSGLAFEAAEGDGWECSAEEQLVTCVHAAALAVDESSTFDLTVAVGAEAYTDEESEVANTATVSAPEPDPGPGDEGEENDTSTVTRPVLPLVDLVVEKRHEGDFGVAVPGEFELTVRNDGPNPHPESAIVVTDQLPAGLPATAASGDGWDCEIDDTESLVTCEHAGPLAVEAELPPILVTVDVGPEAAPSATNVARVATEVVEDSTDNNEAADEVTIVPLANVSVSKSLSGQLAAGEQAVWRVVATNDGPSPADDVTIVDSVPGAFIDISGAGDGFACTVAGTDVTCVRVSPLAAGASAEIVITATASPESAGAITNVATVSTSTDETTDEDNRASADGSITPVVIEGNTAVSDNAATSDSGQSGAQQLAFTGLSILGLLASAAAFVVGGFMLTGFGRRRRQA